MDGPEIGSQSSEIRSLRSQVRSQRSGSVASDFRDLNSDLELLAVLHGQIPVDCFLETVSEVGLSCEAKEFSSPARVQATARLAVRFARIPNHMPLKARYSSDLLD